jgi:putative DNA primase/helicase
MRTESPQQAARRLANKPLAEGFNAIALHVYEDKEGEPLYWHIRLKHPKTLEKWIRPMSCNEQGIFVLKEPSFTSRKPLYRLADVISHPDETVWITEGEACADQLAKLGLVATTSGSVDSVTKTDWSPLANRKIIIWPDNDEAGSRYAHEITLKLRELGCNIQWVDIAQLNLPSKGDCVDWLLDHPNATRQNVEALPCTAMYHPLPLSSPMLQGEQPSTNFVVKNTGVFYNDNEVMRWICSKLEVIALVRDPLSENWGRLLEFYDADEKLHQWAMPMEMLKGGGDELRGELLRLGLEIASTLRMRSLLIEYIMTSKPKARARCVVRTGWHPPVFVLPNRTIGNTSEKIIFQSENPSRDYKQSGTLMQWQQAIALPCQGNSRLVLAISCALAALLLQPAGVESGGLNFVGESSTGKTTALRIAASVYGAPDYLYRWRATTNGLEALAAVRCDTLLILDELAQVDPKEAGEIAYMLANGSGKARASRSGRVKSKHEWRVLFLSAGEISLAQHMREVGKKAKTGQEVRLVDIPADAKKGYGIFEALQGYESAAIFSKALMDATHQYYGTAAPAFLERITALYDTTSLLDLIKELCKKFMTKYLPEKSNGQVHRVCERFALIATAGEIATDFGITGWTSGEATQAAAQCFGAWVEQRGGAENQERSIILSQVRRFFEAHGESRFSDWNAQHSRTINRAGFKKISGESTLYYVLPEIFKEEICAGLEYRRVVDTLLIEGCLELDNNSPSRREYLPGLGRSRCYAITPKLWEN